MLKIDSPTLASIITFCFNLSMDGRLTSIQRDQFLRLGIGLRGDLVTALSAQFDDTTAEVTAANTQLKSVNNDLQTLSINLTTIDTVVKNATAISGVLDGLLKLAIGFH